jgi:hypothetical protein
VNAPEVIASQLGKEFLLNVATDLQRGTDWLAFRARGSFEVVRINMLGIDKFEHAGRRLYAYQLRESVEAAIGAYDDIHAEVEEIFRASQDDYRLECEWLWLMRLKWNHHRAHREWRSSVRAQKVGVTCACGCGQRIPHTRCVTKRLFATKACKDRAQAARLSDERRRRREAAAKVISCQCGCGRSVPVAKSGVFRYATKSCCWRFHRTKRK